MSLTDSEVIDGLFALAADERRESYRADAPGSPTHAASMRRVELLETAAARLRALILACNTEGE